MSAPSEVCAPRLSRQAHRPGEEHQKKKHDLVPRCCPRDHSTFPPRCLHVLRSRPHALGCQRKPRPSDIISSTFSSNSSLHTFHSPPSPPRCHSKERQLPLTHVPHAASLFSCQRSHPWLAFQVPPTNSLPRFACDDCSDCGLGRWFPCSHHSLHPALLSTLTIIDSCFAALCRPVTFLATIQKNNLRRIYFAMSRNTRENGMYLSCTHPRITLAGARTVSSMPTPTRAPMIPSISSFRASTVFS